MIESAGCAMTTIQDNPQLLSVILRHIKQYEFEEIIDFSFARFSLLESEV